MIVMMIVQVCKVVNSAVLCAVACWQLPLCLVHWLGGFVLADFAVWLIELQFAVR